MKLIPISEEDEIVVSLVTEADHIKWFREGSGWKLVGTTDSLPTALRDAGVKRLRLTKPEENDLGDFVRAETYFDGKFQHQYFHFTNNIIAIETLDAMNSAQLALMRHFGTDERYFHEKTVELIELLGYTADPDELTLEGIGAKKSLKAKYGRPEFVRRYRRGSRVLGVAKFETVIQLIVENPQHFQEMYRELGITFSPERLERRVRELLGNRSGTLRAVLLNRAEVTLTVNHTVPDWLQILWEVHEMNGGGILAIEPEQPLLEPFIFTAKA